MARLDAMGMSVASLSSSKGLDRSLTKALAIVCGITVLIAFVATGVQYKVESRQTELGERQILSDQNQFESAPAWDANWDIDEFRHHFIQTERQQTEINKKRDAVFTHMDAEIEEIMALLRKRPPGASGPVGVVGPVGPAGKDGNKGPTGDPGPNGKNGAPGAKGADGTNGVDGRDGTPGATGAPGDTGPAGYPGRAGEAGRNGISGAPGVTGVPGPQGVPGDVGPRGGLSGVHVIHHVTNGDYYRPSPPPDNEESMPYWQYDEARAQKEEPRAPISLSDHTPQAEPVQERPAQERPVQRYSAQEEWDERAFQDAEEAHQKSQLHITPPAPPPSQRAEEGYKRRGTIAVSKVDANGYYYINILGEASHKLKAVLQGTDGYHRRWQGLDQIYTGPLKSGDMGSKDYLKVQDLSTGETQYFRFKFS